MLDSNESQSLQQNKKYVIKNHLYPGVQTTSWTHRGPKEYPKRSYLCSCAYKPIPLICPLKEWKRDYLPKERVKKMGKTGSQQVLGIQTILGAL